MISLRIAASTLLAIAGVSSHTFVFGAETDATKKNLRVPTNEQPNFIADEETLRRLGDEGLASLLAGATDSNNSPSNDHERDLLIVPNDHLVCQALSPVEEALPSGPDCIQTGFGVIQEYECSFSYTDQEVARTESSCRSAGGYGSTVIDTLTIDCTMIVGGNAAFVTFKSRNIPYCMPNIPQCTQDPDQFCVYADDYWAAGWRFGAGVGCIARTEYQEVQRDCSVTIF